MAKGNSGSDGWTGKQSGEKYTSIAGSAPPNPQGSRPGGFSTWNVVGGNPGGPSGGKAGSK